MACHPSILLAAQEIEVKKFFRCVMINIQPFSKSNGGCTACQFRSATKLVPFQRSLKAFLFTFSGSFPCVAHLCLCCKQEQLRDPILHNLVFYSTVHLSLCHKVKHLICLVNLWSISWTEQAHHWSNRTIKILGTVNTVTKTFSPK